MPYKDPAAEKAYRKAWWAKNRDNQLARLKERYRSNPEYYRERSKAWSLAHHGWQRGRMLKRRRKFPFHHLLKIAEERAKRKGVAFALTREWASARWTGKCEITGLPFAFREDGKTGPLPRSPSIDRIKPELGYIPENCRFALACINSFKHLGTDQDMLEVCQAILNSPLFSRT